jgi:hypothetical protein
MAQTRAAVKVPASSRHLPEQSLHARHKWFTTLDPLLCRAPSPSRRAPRLRTARGVPSAPMPAERPGRRIAPRVRSGRRHTARGAARPTEASGRMAGRQTRRTPVWQPLSVRSAHLPEAGRRGPSARTYSVRGGQDSGQRRTKEEPGNDLLSRATRAKYHRRRRLNGRVRDGNGCCPSAMVTGHRSQGDDEAWQCCCGRPARPACRPPRQEAGGGGAKRGIGERQRFRAGGGLNAADGRT